MNAERQLSNSPVQGWRQLNDGAIKESEGQRRVDRRPTGVEEGKRVTVTSHSWATVALRLKALVQP